jgi:hypothetical protein
MNFLKLFIVLLVFSGCSASLPLYQSSIEKDYSPSETKFGYDETSDLTWWVTNDVKNLYLRLKTPKRTTQTKILRAGLKIYFDPTGEKSELTYLNFPIFKERQRPSGEETERRRNRRPGGERPKFDINETIKKIPAAANFVQGEKETPFNYISDKSTFNIELTSEEEGVLNYLAVIPFDQIQPGGLNDISKLSIGMVSGAFEMPVRTGRGMRPGGDRPGGGGGGIAEMQKRMSEMIEPVKIWASLKLVK